MLGQRVVEKDDSRNRFGRGDDELKEGLVTDTIELTFDDPETTIYSAKLQILEGQGLGGMLTVMKWQATLKVDGQVVSDICSFSDYADKVLNGVWTCDLKEKHELLVLDNGCT